MLNAITASILALVLRKTPGASAENAGRFMFSQHDAVSLQKDLQLVAFLNIQIPSNLDGKYNSPQPVHRTDDACSLHDVPFFP